MKSFLRARIPSEGCFSLDRANCLHSPGSASCSDFLQAGFCEFLVGIPARGGSHAPGVARGVSSEFSPLLDSRQWICWWGGLVPHVESLTISCGRWTSSGALGRAHGAWVGRRFGAHLPGDGDAYFGSADDAEDDGVATGLEAAGKKVPRSASLRFPGVLGIKLRSRELCAGILASVLPRGGRATRRQCSFRRGAYDSSLYGGILRAL